MSEQTSLIMPCLPCAIPCPWPPAPASQVLSVVTGMVNQLCVDCFSLNLPYVMSLTERVVEPIGISCTYEQDFSPGACNFTKAVFSASNIGIQPNVLLRFSLQDELGFQEMRWTRTLIPPETEQNGPFQLFLTVGSILCNEGLAVILVSGI